MPRRHKSPRHIPYTAPQNESTKKRFPSKNAAERAAEVLMLQNPGLELRVYQATDGGWYLTRQTTKEN
ncbi:hypothetical protein KC953_03265 [Candidatus Saccharibacteria bacterium]|nr:hypothetical protein [Candidatus Saccharibacteria bacterium]